MKLSLTSLPTGKSQLGSKQSASEYDIESLVVLPQPMEEPDAVLANRRHPPAVQEDVTTLLLNSMLDTVVHSWEGVPTMRPILKRASSASPPIDDTMVVDEQLDVVPDTIASPLVRGPRSKLDNRHRRSKEPASVTLVGLKNRKKASKNSVDRSAISIVEADSSTSKNRKNSLDKKKRRPSKEKRLRRVSDDESHRDDKSAVTGEESGGEDTDNKDETNTRISAHDIGGRTMGSSVDLVMQPEKTPTLSVDSWYVHFPDETAKIVLKHGCHYEGRISRKLMEGEGIFTWADGTQYHGEFVGGEMTGRGKMTWPNTSRYEGEFVKGWRYGRGLYVVGYEKLAYVGNWVEGRKHGRGLIFYNERGTDMYDGEWSSDQRQGYGLRVYPSGARYLGGWQQGLRDGVGTMFFANGDIYTGNWEKGFMNGYGEYIWEAYLNRTLTYFGDNVYSGWFENGTRQGEAMYQLKGGQYIHGEWNTDVKEGKARVVCSDGCVYVGKPVFEDDRPIAKNFKTTCKDHSQPEMKHISTKNVSIASLISKTRKFEETSLQSLSGHKTNNGTLQLSDPLPPNPSLVLHGYYLPIYAPFQCIDLHHHLSLLKALKRQKESTGCQTDDHSLHGHSHHEQTSMGERSGSKKDMTETKDTDAKVKLKCKSLPNEQSTQTDESWIEPLEKIPKYDEEIASPQKYILQETSSKNESKNLKVRESRIYSQKSLVNVDKTHKRSLVRDTSKGNLQRRRQSRLPANKSQTHERQAQWPFRPKVEYPGGLTEESYEERWLRRTITTHLPAIRRAYDEYAQLCFDDHEVPLEPFLLRVMLWQFYRDCKVTTRVTLVELDRMMASNRLSRVTTVHCPFERINPWQFIYRCHSD